MRRFAHILCLLAMLLQVATGSLPAGEACFGSCAGVPQQKMRCCCCEGDDEPADGAGSCPMMRHEGGDGCDRCVRVQIPGRDVNVTARVAVERASDVLVAVLPPPVVVEYVDVGLAPVRRGHSPPTESPPQLGHLRSVRLLV